MNTEIKLASEQDLEFVYKCICDLENSILNQEVFSKIFTRNLQNTEFAYFIAYYENLKVGFMSIHSQYLLHHVGKVAEIQELFVVEKYRNKNIGAELLKTSIEYCKNNNCVQMEVASNKTRLQAHNFYKKNGFSESHFKFVVKFNS